ncbi:MAG: Rpn family recombination-promoting nuclease/putative transposase [Alphaproteobacteria bacterium]
MKRKITNPHDKFFRSMMEHPTVIREFLQTNLPAVLRDSLEYDSIKPIKSAFISSKLQEQIADVLYKAKCGDHDAYFYVLIEHQSSADKLMPFRIEGYIREIQKQHMKVNNTDRLPIVWPVVFYTGAKSYDQPMHPYDLYDRDRETVSQIMSPPYTLLDLSQQPEELLAATRMYGTMSRIFKHIHDDNIIPFLVNIIHETLADIDREGEEDYIELVIRYVYSAAQTIDQNEFVNAVTKLESVDEETIMTLAQQAQQKGIQIGIQKGMQQGITSLVIKMHSKGFNTKKISEMTDMPESLIMELLAKAHSNQSDVA